jgi:prepilin-type processing-associated H-X9-DG protein
VPFTYFTAPGAAVTVACNGGYAPLNVGPTGVAAAGFNLSSTAGGYSPLFWILPFVEQQEAYDIVDTNYFYNSTQNQSSGTAVGVAAGFNGAGQQVIPTYLCPTNPLRPRNGMDSLGFGYTDYGATVYTNIDPTWSPAVNGSVALNASKNKWRVNGGLTAAGNALERIIDGTTKTIMFAEDVGRNELMAGAYPDPTGNQLPATDTGHSGDVATGADRAFWRWIEPDNGFGVNGPPNNVAVAAVTGSGIVGADRAINNNSYPFGGAAAPGCSWNGSTHCGPNDEIFSFHGFGANVVFMDGHVNFLSQDTNPVVLRFLVSSAEKVSPGVFGVSDY